MDGIGEMAEQAVKCVDGCLTVGERGEWLGNFAHLGAHHDLLAFPIAGQAFEEVVALNVAVVVGPGHIRRVHVNQIAPRLDAEHVAAGHGIPPAVAEHGGVVGFDLFDEMLADGELEVAASVLVAGGIADGEESARLAFDGGAQHGGEGHCAFEWRIHLADARPEVVEGRKLLRRVENTVESAADEAFGVQPGFRGEEKVEIGGVQAGGVVGDDGGGEDAGEGERIVGADLLAHGLEQVGDDAGTGEGVGGGGEVDLGKCVVNPWQQAEFATHVAEPGKVRHLRRKPSY